ncbi:MAG TPA: DUF262 domain-containing protein [Candidatus Angelobacter sp.]|jgi:hypothetical protein
MIAGEKTLRATLTEQKQYVIPMFQRYYSWDKTDWEKLWDDISELRAARKPGKQHFMGTLVFVPESVSTLRVPSFLVIDGQQRIITLSLLLCAIRNLATQNGFADLADEITETVLIHSRKKGAERFRVYPRLRDREDFFASIDGGASGGMISQAVQYFAQQIKSEIEAQTESELNDFFNFLLSGLMFVHINLDSENPYTIFSSLNSTGKELSEADLIRNFVFMHVPLETQDEFDKRGKCPYCGIGDIKGIYNSKREAYDHYLPKGIYPFNSVNFRNLAPMCHECNSSYKLGKDPIRQNGTRRKSFFSYATAPSGITVSMTLKKRDVMNLRPADIDLQIASDGRDQEVETWKDVFAIEERYKSKCCGENDGKAWLQQVLEEGENVNLSPAQLLNHEVALANRFPYDGARFLKRAFLVACKDAALI